MRREVSGHSPNDPVPNGGMIAQTAPSLDRQHQPATAKERHTRTPLSPGSVSNERIVWIDAAKGMGIVLVVLGHIPGYDASLVDLIFMFHMPMFFMLSGMNYRVATARTVARSKLISLMIPLYSFLITVALVDLIISSMDGIQPFLDPDRPLLAAARFILIGSTLFGPVGALWFLNCLFLVFILYTIAANMFGSVQSPGMVVLAISCIAISSLLYSWIPTEIFGIMAHNPWSIFTLPAAFFYFWAGVAFSRCSSISWRLVVTCSIAAMLITIPFSDNINMKAANNGNLLNPAAAIAMSLFVFSLAYSLRWIPLAEKVFASMGRISLTIMCTHMLLITHLHNLVDRRLLLVLCLLLAFPIHHILSRLPLGEVLFQGKGRLRNNPERELIS